MDRVASRLAIYQRPGLTISKRVCSLCCDLFVGKELKSMIETEQAKEHPKRRMKKKLWKPIKKIFSRSKHQRLSANQFENLPEILEKSLSHTDCDLSSIDRTYITDRFECSISSPGPSTASIDSDSKGTPENGKRKKVVKVPPTDGIENESFQQLDVPTLELADFLGVTPGTGDLSFRTRSSLSKNKDADNSGGDREDEVEIVFSKDGPDDIHTGPSNAVSLDDSDNLSVFLSFNGTKSGSKSHRPPTPVPPPVEQNLSSTEDHQHSSHAPGPLTRDSTDSVTWVSHDTAADSRPMAEISIASGLDKVSISTASASGSSSEVDHKDPVIRIRDAIFSSFADISARVGPNQNLIDEVQQKVDASAEGTSGQALEGGPQPEHTTKKDAPQQSSGVKAVHVTIGDEQPISRVFTDEETEDGTLDFLNMLSEEGFMKSSGSNSELNGTRENTFQRDISLDKQHSPHRYDKHGFLITQELEDSDSEAEEEEEAEVSESAQHARTGQSLASDNDWFDIVEPWEIATSESAFSRKDEESNYLMKNFPSSAASSNQPANPSLTRQSNIYSAAKSEFVNEASAVQSRTETRAVISSNSDSESSLNEATTKNSFRLEAGTVRITETSCSDFDHINYSRTYSRDFSVDTESFSEYNNKRSFFCGGGLFDDNTSHVDDELSTVATQERSMGRRTRSMLDSIGTELAQKVEILAREGSTAVRSFVSKHRSSSD